MNGEGIRGRGGLSSCIRRSIDDRVFGLVARTVYTIVGESFKKLPERVVIVGVRVVRSSIGGMRLCTRTSRWDVGGSGNSHVVLVPYSVDINATHSPINATFVTQSGKDSEEETSVYIRLENSRRSLHIMIETPK